MRSRIWEKNPLKINTLEHVLIVKPHTLLRDVLHITISLS